MWEPRSNQMWEPRSNQMWERRLSAAIMEFLKQLKAAIAEDRLDIVAGGIAFYLFLALFPAMIAGLSIYGLVADPQTIAQHVDRLAMMMPASAVDVVKTQIDALLGAESKGLSLSAAIAILLALVSANKGAKALVKGLNIAYNETEHRGFIKKNLVTLGLTCGFLLFLAISIALIAIVPGMFENLPLIAEVLKWVLLLVLILVALGVIYRYGPATAEPRWSIVAIGSITAALLWLGASALFAWFAKNFGNFNETYGMIAGAAVLLLWLQISSFVILLGAEINHVLRIRRANPSPAGILDFEI